MACFINRTYCVDLIVTIDDNNISQIFLQVFNSNSHRLAFILYLCINQLCCNLEKEQSDKRSNSLVDEAKFTSIDLCVLVILEIQK